MKHYTLCTAALAIALTATPLTGCSDDKNENQKPEIDNPLTTITLTRAQQELVTASNDFAFNLFRSATMPGESGSCVDPAEAPKSVILSPISITYALGMLNNGAAGETQQQINNVLGFADTGADGINAFCQKMLTEAPSLDKLTKVMIANNIYLNENYRLLPDFVAKAKDFYDAEPETRNFADGQTCDAINHWASEHTEGMIDKVLSADSFDPDAVSYLLNAIYFKGAWAEKFDKGDTRDEDFEGCAKKVPMMHQEHEFHYTDNELCQAMSLPYGNGAYTMTVLLPHEGKTVDELLLSLSAESWQQYQGMSPTRVDVKLPRFETKTDIDLKAIMSNLGMPKAFDRYEAEFPAFCNVPTCIDMMKQVARIKLDEEGTEAAAVTVIGVVDMAMHVEPKPVTFYATRPFLYVISEQSTGAIFFIGKYVGD